MDVEQLVNELIGSGMLDEDAIADLRQNYLEEWRKGTLHPDDLGYLQAFHARILDPERLAEIEQAAGVVDTDVWQARLDDAIARAERAEAKVIELEKLLSERSS